MMPGNQPRTVTIADRVASDRSSLPKDLESRLQDAWLQTQLKAQLRNMDTFAKEDTDIGEGQGESSPFEGYNTASEVIPSKHGVKRQRSSRHEENSQLAFTLEKLWNRTQSGKAFQSASSSMSTVVAPPPLKPASNGSVQENGSNAFQNSYMSSRDAPLDVFEYLEEYEKINRELEEGLIGRNTNGEPLFGGIDDLMEEEFLRGIHGLHEAFDELEHHHMPYTDLLLDDSLPEAISPKDSSSLPDFSMPPLLQKAEEIPVLPSTFTVDNSLAANSTPSCCCSSTSLSPSSISAMESSKTPACDPKNCLNEAIFQFHEQLPGTNNTQPPQQERCETKSRLVHLLMEVANAVVSKDKDKVDSMVEKLSGVASQYGDMMQRVSTYFLKGLHARLAKEEGEEVEPNGGGLGEVGVEEEVYSNGGKPPASECKRVKSLLESFQVIMNASPYLTFGNVAANATILEAFAGQSHVHIVDFGIGFGLQWPALIQAFAARPGGPPHIRLTGVEEGSFRGGGLVRHTAYCLKYTGLQLAELAKLWCVPFEFHALQCQLQEVKVEMLNLRDGESVAVNCPLRLHQLVDESEQSMAVIETISQIKPVVCTVVEQYSDQSSPFYLTRFYESLFYYLNVMDSIDQSVSKEESPALKLFEEQFLGRAIVSVVASEGKADKAEAAMTWDESMQLAGFEHRILSDGIVNTVKALLQTYQSGYRLVRNEGRLTLTWNDKPLLAMTSWKPKYL